MRDPSGLKAAEVTIPHGRGGREIALAGRGVPDLRGLVESREMRDPSGLKAADLQVPSVAGVDWMALPPR